MTGRLFERSEKTAMLKNASKKARRREAGYETRELPRDPDIRRAMNEPEARIRHGEGLSFKEDFGEEM